MVAVGTTEQVPDLTKLREVARQFEALFVGMLLRSMRNTVIEADILDPQGEAKYYRQLYDDELARLTAERGEGLGVADLIVNQYAARLAAEAAYGTEMASSLADGKLRSPGSSSGRER